MAKKGTLEELCPPVTAIINSHTGEKTPIDLTPIWMIQAQEEVDREAREIAKWEEEEKREVALRKKNSIPALLTNGDGLLCCPQCGHHECMSMLQCSMDKYEITIEFRCYMCGKDYAVDIHWNRHNTCRIETRNTGEHWFEG